MVSGFNSVGDATLFEDLANTSITRLGPWFEGKEARPRLLGESEVNESAKSTQSRPSAAGLSAAQGPFTHSPTGPRLDYSPGTVRHASGLQRARAHQAEPEADCGRRQEVPDGLGELPQGG